MAQQTVVIVNASSVLKDADVAAIIPALQLQLDRDFLPAWAMHNPVAMKLEFLPWHEYKARPTAGEWPIFLNRHSVDPGALGWHTDEGQKIYGRVFVGDCMRYGISWTTDLTHEILETAADPEADRAYKMPDGRMAAIEVCDAVEADAEAYEINGVKVSNFVYPAYFSDRQGAKYDYKGSLRAPCPALTPGGYMSIYANGAWGQIQEDRADGLLGRRALMRGWRRLTRGRVGDPVEIIGNMA